MRSVFFNQIGPKGVHVEHLVMVEYAGNLYFGFAYEVVFAVFRDYVGNVGGICFAEYASGKIFEISLFVTRLYGIGVPCIVHYEIDRDFFRFQIAYIYNPDAVDAGTVGKVELLPEFWNCGGIYPSVIPRASVHVDVVVHSQAAFAFALIVGSDSSDVSPVIVAKE